jgi:hypothetical protein
MSILILRRLVKRYRSGGTTTGSGTSNYIPMFTPMGESVKEREYTKFPNRTK